MRKQATDISPTHLSPSHSANSTTVQPDEDAVAKLAYQLWAQRGRPEGSSEEDWYRAQEILRSGKALTASSS